MNNDHPIGGPLSALSSILLSIFAWISLKDAQVIMAMCASGIAIISGGFAIAYYYKQINKKQ